MGLTHTPESKVTTIWICRELLCSILTVSTYYARQSDILVKIYDHFNFSRASVVHFRASRYIKGLTHTPESKVMAVWISRELTYLISSVSIYYEPESEIRVKCYDHLNFSRASVIHFWASLYIIGLTHTPESKVMAVWIFRELPCSISTVSIYYAHQSDILVKIYDHLSFSRASVVHFLASRYIMGLTHTPESKVMVVWICRELRCSISSVSTYYEPQSDIRLKCYDHLNFSKASVVLFRASQYIMGLTHTVESNVMAVWIIRDHPCSISSVSIYYAPESEIRVKSYDHLNFSRASLVHFRASRYIMGLTHTPESKVLAVRICRELLFSISNVSTYYAPP